MDNQIKPNKWKVFGMTVITLICVFVLSSLSNISSGYTLDPAVTVNGVTSLVSLTVAIITAFKVQAWYPFFVWFGMLIISAALSPIIMIPYIVFCYWGWERLRVERILDELENNMEVKEKPLDN